MKEKLECKIMQDYLIPNYIEKLTDEETNQYIEKHLNECNSCKNAYKTLVDNENIEKKKRNETSLNYFKKFNKKLKILKTTILSIFLIAFLVFSISTGRKMIIIYNLSQKAKSYENKTNYHETLYVYSNGTFSKMETFILDDRIRENGKEIREDKVSQETIYGIKNYNLNDEVIKYDTHDYYTEMDGEKIVIIDGNLFAMQKIPNVLHTQNLWELFTTSVRATVKETKIKDKECYYIHNLKTAEYDFPQNELYIDKETGLLVYDVYSDDSELRFTESVYEFDTVKEEDFIEPDKSEYKVLTLSEYIERFNK